MSNTNPYNSPEANLAPEPSGNFTFHEPRTVGIGRGCAWIGEGFGYFKQNPGHWILTCIVGFILMMILAVIPLVNLAVGLFTYVWLAGLVLGVKAQYDGEDFNVSYLFAGFKNNFGQLVLLGLIMLIASFGIMFAVLGSLFLQIAQGNTEAIMADPTAILLGFLIAMAIMIPLMMAFWFAPSLIVLNNIPVFAALKYSFIACLKNFLPFLIYGILFFLLYIIAIIPLALGLLVIMPMFFASIFASYKDIFID